MKAEITITINHCIDCPHHRIMSDPDRDDWFNDDEAMVCLHPDCHREYSEEEKKCYKGWKGVIIEGSCRPYETPKVKIPEYCPLLTKE